MRALSGDAPGVLRALVCFWVASLTMEKNDYDTDGRAGAESPLIASQPAVRKTGGSHTHTVRQERVWRRMGWKEGEGGWNRSMSRDALDDTSRVESHQQIWLARSRSRLDLFEFEFEANYRFCFTKQSRKWNIVLLVTKTFPTKVLRISINTNKLEIKMILARCYAWPLYCLYFHFDSLPLYLHYCYF